MDTQTVLKWTVIGSGVIAAVGAIGAMTHAGTDVKKWVTPVATLLLASSGITYAMSGNKIGLIPGKG